jgi:hypothetical protein
MALLAGLCLGRGTRRSRPKKEEEELYYKVEEEWGAKAPAAISADAARMMMVSLFFSIASRLVVAYQHEMCTRVTEWKKLVTSANKRAGGE